MSAFPLSGPRLEFFRSATDRPAARPGGAGLPPLRRGGVLALADVTPEGANAAWRAGLVARDRGAPLHLLCVTDDEERAGALESALQELAQRIQDRLHVATAASCVAGKLRTHLEEAAEGADLLVLPWRRGNLLADALLGTLPERVFRALSMPMLVVRRPAYTSYRRVLVPVKLDPDAVTLVSAARGMSRDPRMRVFHVLDTWHEGSLRLADIPERTLRLQRQRRSRTAYGLLTEIITRAGAQAQGAAALVSFGNVPARVLEIARAGNAQLIVAGKERRSPLVEAFFAGVTQRLLTEADADVLVLPVVTMKEGLGGPVPEGSC